MNIEHYNEPCHSDPYMPSGLVGASQQAAQALGGDPDFLRRQRNAAAGARAQAQNCSPVMPNPVRQPAHYARCVIDPVTFVGANNLPFDVGNVVKYVCRFDAKNGREDLRKASRYIEMIIERLDREDRVKAGEDAATVWSKIL